MAWTTKLTILAALAICISCGTFAERKTIETVRGSLTYFVKLRFGPAGVHGGDGWVREDAYFQFDGRRHFGKEEFDGCDPSPNLIVEAFRCYRFQNLDQIVTIVSVKSGQIATEEILREPAVRSSGKNAGTWVSETDGRWLLFKDFLINVESGERRPVSGLPDYPDGPFRAVSPDLSTIVMEGDCFYGFPEADGELKRRRDLECSRSEGNSKQRLITLWLIDPRDGSTKIQRIRREDHKWLIWDQNDFPARADWLRYFQSKLVWLRDRDGRFSLKF